MLVLKPELQAWTIKICCIFIYLSVLMVSYTLKSWIFNGTFISLRGRCRVFVEKVGKIYCKTFQYNIAKDSLESKTIYCKRQLRDFLSPFVCSPNFYQHYSFSLKSKELYAFFGSIMQLKIKDVLSYIN